MKKKIIPIIIIIGAIIMIAIGTIIVVGGVKRDEEAIKKAMDSIVTDYETFKKEIENFSTQRESIYNEVMNTPYYSDVFNNYNSNIEKIKTYENLVSEIDKSSKGLKTNCVNKRYKDQDITNKCNAFIINYEQSMNYFVNDITRFNTRIDEYNDWSTTANTDKKYTKLEKYDSKYNKYVDINNDKVFSGKAES